MTHTELLLEPIIGTDYDRTISIDVKEPGLGGMQASRRMTWSEFADACNASVSSVPTIKGRFMRRGLDLEIKHSLSGAPGLDEQIPEGWQLEVGWDKCSFDNFRVFVSISYPQESPLRGALKKVAHFLDDLLPFGSTSRMEAICPRMVDVIKNVRDALAGDDAVRLVRRRVWSAHTGDFVAAIMAATQLSRALMWSDASLDNDLRGAIDSLGSNLEF